MAQLKDTLVSGSLRATDTVYTTKLQTGILYAPTSSSGTTYGPGSADNILLSNGSSIYWGTIGDVEVIKLKGINNSGVAAVGSANRPTTANLNYTDGSVRYFLATSAMESSSKPTMGDSHILHLAWDNTAYAAQLAVEHIKSETSYVHAQIRGQGSTQGNWSNWFYLLDENNYTDYTVKKDGTGATGTWGISITGNAATATGDKNGNDITTTYLPLTGGTLSGKLTVGTTSQSAAPTGAIHVHDIRNYTIPTTMFNTGVNWFFTAKGTPTTGKYWSGMHINGWNGDYNAWELVGPSHNEDQRTTPLYVRSGRTTGGWGSWRKIYDSSNVPTKSEIGLGNVENTALSTWTGSSNITTVGTISSGTWNGTVIGVSHGGTGATSFTSGALLIGNGTGAVGTRTIKDLTSKNNLGWTDKNTDIYIPTVNTLAYWNGRYNSSSSNLTYCIKGEFGDAAIKGVVTTLDTSANLPTAGAVSTAISNALGDYVTLATQQTVSGRKTFQNLATTTFKGSTGSEYCNINYNQTLGALVFSFG